MSDITRMADMQVTIRQYGAFAKIANDIIQDNESLIRYYDKMKELTEYQQKQRAKAQQTISAFTGLMSIGKELIKHFEFQEGEAWEHVAKSATQNLEYSEIMKEKYAEKCRELEEAQEMLQLFIKDLAA